MCHDQKSQELFIIFTRYPEAGKAKTRLIPAMGAEGAAGLQRLMSEHIFAEGLKLAKKRQLKAEVHFDGGDLKKMNAWVPSGVICRKQYPGSLGDRLQSSFTQGITAGYDRIIIVGADCPFLSWKIVEKGFNYLKKRDLVLGPAQDGGYYLIGLSRGVSRLWSGVSWGTEFVLEQTLRKANELGLSFSLLPTLTDIDRPEDLKYLSGITTPFSSLHSPHAT